MALSFAAMYPKMTPDPCPLFHYPLPTTHYLSPLEKTMTKKRDWYWSVLIALLCAVIIAAVSCVALSCPGAELTVRVQSFPPGQPLKPGTTVTIWVEGLEPGQVVVWHRSAVEGDFLLEGKFVINGKARPAYQLVGSKPGPRTFTAQVPSTSPAQDPFASTTFSYGTGDVVVVNPPEPPTPPVPPVPPGVKRIVVIEETDAKYRTPAIGNLVTRLRIEAAGGWIQKAGYELLILDRNQVVGDRKRNETAHPLVAKYLKADDVLPVVLVFVGGEAVRRQTLQGSSEAVKKWVVGEARSPSSSLTPDP